MSIRKRWPTKQCLHVPIPLYGGALYVFKEKEAYKQAQEYLGNDDPLPLVNGISQHRQNDKTGASIFLVGVFAEGLPTLAHELLHVTFYIGSHAGLTPDDHEAYCYLHGHLFDKTYKYIGTSHA